MALAVAVVCLERSRCCSLLQFSDAPNPNSTYAQYTARHTAKSLAALGYDPLGTRIGHPSPCERRGDATYLVDPASSHMLVSKIKPCMSKYKLLHSETANGSLNQLWFIRWCYPTWITVVILELIHATKLRPSLERALLLDQDQPVSPSGVPSD